MSETPEADVLKKYFEEGSAVFFRMMQERHLMGEKKYGPIKFTEVNTLNEALEELADFGNYAMYTFMKVWLLSKQIADITADASDPEDKLGVESFIPSMKRD